MDQYSLVDKIQKHIVRYFSAVNGLSFSLFCGKHCYTMSEACLPKEDNAAFIWIPPDLFKGNCCCCGTATSSASSLPNKIAQTTIRGTDEQNQRKVTFIITIQFYYCPKCWKIREISPVNDFIFNTIKNSKCDIEKDLTEEIAELKLLIEQLYENNEFKVTI